MTDPQSPAPHAHRRRGDRLTTGKVVSALLGGLFFLGGAALFLNELTQKAKSNFVLGLSFGAAVFGAGLISPDAIFDRLKRMGAAVRGIWKPKFTGETPTSGPRSDRGVD